MIVAWDLSSEEGRALAAAETSYERFVDPKDEDSEPPGLVKRQRRTVERCLPYVVGMQ